MFRVVKLFQNISLFFPIFKNQVPFCNIKISASIRYVIAMTRFQAVLLIRSHDHLHLLLSAKTVIMCEELELLKM